MGEERASAGQSLDDRGRHGLPTPGQIESALRLNEGFFRSLIEHASDILTIVDGQGLIRYESPAIERLLGYRPDELVGQLAFDYIHPDDRGHVFEIFQSAALLPGVRRSAEFRFRHKDGSWRVLEALGKNLLEDEVVAGVVIYSRDITQRKQAERKLRLLVTLSREISEVEDFDRALEATLRRVCEAVRWNMGEAWTLAPDEQRLIMSPAYYLDDARLEPLRALSEGLSFAPGEGLPGHIWRTHEPTWFPDVSGVRPTRFTRSREASEIGIRTVFGVPIVADGRLLAVLVFGKYRSDSEDHELLELVTAVAAQLGALLRRKQIEADKSQLLAQVETQRAQLQLLARRRQRLASMVITAQEEERSRVARELHDEAGQALTAMRLSLEMLLADLPGVLASPSNESQIAHRLQEVITLSEDTSARIRALANKLRPAALDDLGLDLALEGLCRDFSAWSEVSVNYRGAEVALPSPAEIALYRFLQEALTNVARHAEAEQVWVTLRIADNAVWLTVADNGRGFDPAADRQRDNGHGHGLIGMEERLALLGGRLDIASSVEKGTRLMASIPLLRAG